ncbi:zinc-binding dehydrogenase [Actinosynnema pretiosum subsp. pretiosum]|uniref:Alcohol dehydrogenase zinc-binding domain protein n=2 Tax=Actinosynnema TaxID=40566 RepID=C6WK57_ACTMD|nr:zinc-binding dehydrogenase [Actinosynnema mirum]ACU38270.1 Alcohol dehydrogenase zinc-binding domain protein [Actinosynnema mirum DSM 43827]QUF04215.1 zinc-binding dehydrogenase [Actinosynnema pretiosum subsp. pretiosum]
MRALVVDHAGPGPVRFAEVAEPEPAPHEALVGIRHIALNHGELKHSGQWPDGDVHGHDASGVVLRAAADGSGPEAGSRVVLGMAPHAWAERIAVAPKWLAVVPDGVGLADAAAIGVVGSTALRVLRTRSVLGREVLVTGASGGVGRFAVQLAALAGARVSALVGSPERVEGLRELGARRVAVSVSELAGEFDLVVDTVGGPQLVEVWERVAPGGDVQLVGTASGQPAVFGPDALFSIGEPKTVTTFCDVESAVTGELEVLLDLMARGRLSAEVGLRGHWDGVDGAVRALFAREVRGKVVLDVS